MIFFYMLCIIFFSMLIFPIALAMISTRYETKPLFIQQSNTKDPRYFAVSFKKIFDKAWEAYDGSGILHMSRDEQVIEADKVKLFPYEVLTSMIYAENQDFLPCEGIVFKREIYAKRNAVLSETTMLRAIACEKNLIIKSGAQVIRWADSQGVLTVYGDCDLGISTSSGTQLIIGQNCYFKRLYAPIIWLGRKIDEIDKDMSDSIKKEAEVLIFNNTIRDIKYVDDQITNEKGILKNTIITSESLVVLGGFIVQGHIRSHKDVKIDDNAVVCGNIFAEGNIFIGVNARVLGVVFSQESIYVGDRAVIGQPGKIKSIVARGDILFGSNCRMHGYIGAEGTGRICPKAWK